MSFLMIIIISWNWPVETSFEYINESSLHDICAILLFDISFRQEVKLERILEKPRQKQSLDRPVLDYRYSWSLSMMGNNGAFPFSLWSIPPWSFHTLHLYPSGIRAINWLTLGSSSMQTTCPAHSLYSSSSSGVLSPISTYCAFVFCCKCYECNTGHLQRTLIYNRSGFVYSIVGAWEYCQTLRSI